MTLIGFSREKLNDRTALPAVLNVVTPRFGKTGFCFAINADSDSNEADEFSFDEGLKVLQRDSCLSFFKNGEVSVWLDNQAYNDRYWIYPHSTIEIALAADQQQGRGCSVQLSDWLEMAKSVFENA
jgi:hypothetical protein